MASPQTPEQILSPKPPVSERQAEANRENALKSTGPKTPRGKSYSRQNSLKHGLFAKDLITEFMGCSENPQGFHALLDELQREYCPVGPEEGLEVQLIAVCWWRLNRAWRYENAEVVLEQSRTARRGEPSEDAAMIRRHETLARLLEQADGEIKAGRVISSELKEQMFAADPSLRGRWPLFQEVAKQKYTELMEAPVQEEEGTPVPVFTGVCLTNPDMQAERARMIDFLTVKLAVAGVGITDLGFACSVRRDFDGIPESNALDRVLRYEASAERRLARALDRLERLQRRRNGEMVPPPVSVRLSR